MIVDIPFFYKAKVRFKRKRNPTDIVCLGMTRVDIAEASPDEAPVALRYVEKGFTSFDESKTVELRLLDGKLYAPLVRDEGSRMPSLHRDLEWLKHRVENQYDYNNPLRIGCNRPYNGPEPRPIGEVEDVAEIIETAEEDEISRAAVLARDLLLIEGHLYETAPEPVYRLHRIGRDFFNGRILEGGWVLSVVPAPGSAKPGRVEVAIDDVYRADQYEIACDLVASDPDRDWLGDPPSPIEVLIPEAVRHDPDPPVIRACAKDCLDLLRDQLFGHEADGILKSLRTIIENTHPRPGEEALLQDLASICEMHDDEPMRCYKALKELLPQPESEEVNDCLALLLRPSTAALTQQNGRSRVSGRVERAMARWERRGLANFDFSVTG